MSEQDWRITPKQELAIQYKVKNLSKREATILLNIIEALYQSRPSSKDQSHQDNRMETTTLASEDTT